MKRKIPFWQMAGFVFTGILGTFLHFLFDLTGGSVAAALISAVNESIFEHIKLLFYPMMAFALLEYFLWGKKIPGFWCVQLWGVLLGLCLIPILYYTYTGIGGISIDWVNIAIFFLSAAAAYRLQAWLFTRSCKLRPWVAVGLLCLLTVIFTVLTFWPPHIPLFQDPITGAYGFQV